MGARMARFTLRPATARDGVPLAFQQGVDAYGTTVTIPGRNRCERRLHSHDRSGFADTLALGPVSLYVRRRQKHLVLGAARRLANDVRARRFLRHGREYRYESVGAT